jgi:hypothetical protein
MTDKITLDLVVGRLLKDYESHEYLLDENGILNQLTEVVIETCYER